MCKVILFISAFAVMALHNSNGAGNHGEQTLQVPANEYAEVMIKAEIGKMLDVFEDITQTTREMDYKILSFPIETASSIFKDRYLDDLEKIVDLPADQQQSSKRRMCAAYYRYKNKLLDEEINPRCLPAIAAMENLILPKLYHVNGAIEYSREILTEVETLFDKFEMILAMVGRTGVHDFQECARRAGFDAAKEDSLPNDEAENKILNCGIETFDQHYHQELLKISKDDYTSIPLLRKILDAFAVLTTKTGMQSPVIGENGELVFTNVRQKILTNPFLTAANGSYTIEYISILDY